ncbi:hypothetical protein THAOC_23248, partial [Thalassiosira oceanica]
FGAMTSLSITISFHRNRFQFWSTSRRRRPPAEYWNIGPGESANSEEALAKGAVPGQVHFFPAIGNSNQLLNGFEKHNCAKIE